LVPEPDRRPRERSRTRNDAAHAELGRRIDAVRADLSARIDTLGGRIDRLYELISGQRS